MSDESGHFRGTVDLHPAERNPVAARLDIFFRGYLANLTALARQVSQGHTAALPVVDVIATCYERWGRTLSTHLDGQFALVIANRQAGEVLLCHDALGVVPLYWSLKKQVLRFATRVPDLVDSDALSGLNMKEVRRYLLFGNPGSDATVYTSINRLETGTSLWIRNGSVSRNTDWDPRCIEPVVYKRSDEYVDHFLGLVHESVKGALIDTDSAWLALSGGLDSNTILPPALKYCPGLKAFSIVSPQWPDADESQWIERIVVQRGLPWHPINAEDVLPFSELPQGFCGAPDSAVFHQRVNAALIGLFGKDIQLTGNGGDSFMGSQMGPAPSHLADPIFNGELSGVVGQLLQWMRQSKPLRPPSYWLYHGLVLPSLRHVLRRSVRLPHYHIHPPWLRCGGRWERNSRALHPRAVAPHCQTPGQQAILDDLWQCAEDQDASDGLYTSRYPLFYRPLFEFLWAIPWSQKHMPLCDRYLQRRALKGLVDDDIRTRIGFGTGSRSFVEGLRRSKPWQDYLCERPAMAGLGLVDADEWRQAIQQACVGQTGAEALLLRAITVEVWLKQLSTFRPVSS
jgi:asparagine synthetase B (glutamine-hydrolysing)